jgi:hypothetical protein
LNKILETLAKEPKEKQDKRSSTYPIQQDKKEGTNPKTSPLQFVNELLKWIDRETN